MPNSDRQGGPNLCPCGNTASYEKCCQPLHLRQKSAQTAEQLMRSRFCAFVKEQWQYLLDTAHPKETAPNAIEELKSWSTTKTWGMLKILKTRQGKANHDTGEVEFVAFYREPSTLSGSDTKPVLHQHHEYSHFKKIDSHWMFTQGIAQEPIKINRNEPCPCNSGKKAKKCCLA